MEGQFLTTEKKKETLNGKIKVRTGMARLKEEAGQDNESLFWGEGNRGVKKGLKKKPQVCTGPRSLTHSRRKKEKNRESEEKK